MLLLGSNTYKRLVHWLGRTEVGLADNFLFGIYKSLKLYNMAKEKEPPTLESLQGEVDELDWEISQLKDKVSDLETELRELKESIPEDPKSDLDELFGRISELESRL